MHTQPASQAVGTESCAAVLINDLKLMNIKHYFAYAVPQAQPLLGLVDAKPMTVKRGRATGGVKIGERAGSER